MLQRRRFATLGVVLVAVAGLLGGCATDGDEGVQAGASTSVDPIAASASPSEGEVDDEGGFGAVGDDCFIDEDGHGPDCDPGVDGQGSQVDDCFIDEDGHGPDCDPGVDGQWSQVDDCFIDEDGHGPDCDPGVDGQGSQVDDCFIDEDGHGPDCEDAGMGLGGPDDLRYLSGWDVDGSGLDVGTVFTLTCEPNGTPGSVWGTGPYSDDSSLCTAAVHAGKITVSGGGTVGGQRIDSRRTLPGGNANGISAQPADNWRGAIEFF